MKINTNVEHYEPKFTFDKNKRKPTNFEYHDGQVSLESSSELQSRIYEKDVEVAKESIIEKIVTSKVGKDKSVRSSKLYNIGRESLFKEVMVEMYVDSLLLDMTFVNENKTNIIGFVHKYIDDRGGIKLLENAIDSSDSKILKDLKVICEKSCKEVCDRKFKDPEDQMIDFDMTEKEKDDFDSRKNDLNLDELTDLVKNKVLTVVKDEKENSAKRDEFITAIEDELSTQDLETEEEVKEAYNKLVIEPKEKDVTLFEALMQAAYKELLENVAVMSYNKETEEEEESKRNVNTDEDDLSDDESEDADGEEKDLYEDEESADDSEQLNEGTVDMDLVLAEAISTYTMYELTNTLKLESFNNKQVREMARSLMV